MDYSIRFPHLGINLSHVPKTFSIFGFQIAVYGICIALGLILAFTVIDKLSKKFLPKPDAYFDIAIAAVICGIIGARIYYVAFEWEHYKGDFLAMINLREGGIAIYGSIIGGAIATIIMCHIKKVNTLDILDCFFPGVVVGQIIGRWGNFFNREAFSEYTDGFLAMQLPVSAVRQHEITEAMWQHVETVNGVDYIQVTPNFLYEGIWNLCLFGILLLIVRNRKFKGQIATTYAMGYGLGRFYLEGLRTDQLTIGSTGLAVSQIVGLVCVIAGVIIYGIAFGKGAISLKHKAVIEKVDASMTPDTNELVLDEVVEETIEEDLANDESFTKIVDENIQD